MLGSRKSRARDTARRFVSLRWLHPQDVIHAIEVIEESDGGSDFDDLAVVVVLLQTVPEFVVHGMRITRFALCQFERSLLGFGEIRAGAEICQVLYLLF